MKFPARRGFEPFEKAWLGLSRDSKALPWLPVLAAFFAIRSLIAQSSATLGTYDEGLLFTNAHLLSAGKTIYKDFYANYPPGVFHLVRLFLAASLPAIWTARLVCLGVRIASALLAGRLVRAGRAQAGCCPWTVALVLMVQEELGLILFCYSIAVLMALVTIWLLPQVTATKRRLALFAVSLASISYLRHDLFVYAMTGILAVEACSWLAQRRPALVASYDQMRYIAAVAAATLTVLWLPVFISSGWYHPLHDLLLDQARLIMPGRVLPVPPLLDPLEVRGLNLTLPGFLVDRTRFGVVLAVAGTSALVVHVVLALIRKSLSPGLVARLSLIAIFALATLPQALQRTDFYHVAYGVPLVGLAVMIVGGPRLGPPLLLVALCTWFADPPVFADTASFTKWLAQRDDDTFLTQERRKLVALIKRETAPGAPVYTGCESHRRITVSPTDLLYLTGRTNATRYVQFDPGTVTSQEGQQAMVSDLERTRPALAVLALTCFSQEPNASHVAGATVLDDYLRQHYGAPRSIGEMIVLRRLR